MYVFLLKIVQIEINFSYFKLTKKYIFIFLLRFVHTIVEIIEDQKESTKSERKKKEIIENQNLLQASNNEKEL